MALLGADGFFPKRDRETFFDDNEQITKPLRAYVNEALERGIITGDIVNGELCFRPQDLITRDEAAKMIHLLNQNASIPTGGFEHLTRYLTYEEMRGLLKCV